MRPLSHLWFVLTLSLAAPAMADAPDDLPGQVAGVIRSGPTLSLKFRPVAGQPTRILSQGDVYADGWVLTALTPSAATLTKAGIDRSIGLNPTGAVDQAPPDAPATKVSVTFTAAELARFDQLVASGKWNGQPAIGLTLDETRRRMLYSDRIAAAHASSADAIKTALGDDDADFIRLGIAGWIGQRQMALEMGDINLVRRFDGLPPIGPDKVIVPAGSSIDEVFSAAGLNGRTGYAGGTTDANGDRIFTRQPVSGPSIAALQALLPAPPSRAPGTAK